jgi:hypothetical protein
MRAAMGELLQQFWSLQSTLSRIERVLPTQIHLPIIQFTDAFGDNLALPYQLCRSWSTFKELLRVMYINRQGWFRVETGQYLIMQARGGRPINQRVWQEAVREGDHLFLCIVVEDFREKEGGCPFPSCDALVDGAENRNGGNVCQECGRWSLRTQRPLISHESSLPYLDYEYVDQNQTQSDVNDDAISEDIENYRQVYVQTKRDLYIRRLASRFMRIEHEVYLKKNHGKKKTGNF